MLQQWNAASDYEELCRWWKAHKWEPVPVGCLPATGFLAVEMGRRIAAVWLYITGTALGIMEWYVVNPDETARLRHAGLSFLATEVPKIAINVGISRIISSFEAPGLMRLMKKHGFVTTDTGVTLMIWGK